MKRKLNKLLKKFKIHLSIIAFTISMISIFISLYCLVPSYYEGELKDLFLDTPHGKIHQIEQENTLE